MAKKLLAVIVSALFIISVVPFVPFTTFAETEGIFTYSVSDGKATITGLVDKNTAGAIEIPSTIGGYPVTEIGYRAFYGCTGLTSITLPNSVTYIGYGAFYGCKGLESIVVDSGNKYYHSAGNCLIETASKTLIKGCNNSVIPNDGSVTSIGYSAFSNCSGLTSITLTNSVTSIGYEAFSYCSGLTSITIPNSVTSIDYRAFAGCSGLESIAVDSGNKYYHSAGNCLIETASKTLIKGCNKSVIPNDGSVTSIGKYAFDGCTGLTSITLTNSVTSIGYRAFYGCTGLTSITLPNSVTYIGNSAFDGCSGLTSITIPDSVTSIDDYAFYGCSELTDVYYTGTQQQKESISIYGNNYYILNATWHYNFNLDNPTCEHTETDIKNAKKATCTENGYTGDKVCAYCSEILEHGEVIPALGHNGKWKTITKATLTEKGLMQEICSRCGEILNEQEIPALGVTYSVDTAKENIEENISVAQSAGSNLPETVEVKAEKTNADDKQVTYEIRLEDKGEVIQPEAPVLVKLPIPAGFDKDKLNIYRTEPDGRKTRLDFIIDGDYAYFETDHFSIYEIIEKLCGDISGDGSLNNGDLVTLFQYLSGWGNEVNRKAVDVNGDGKENNQDLVLLFQFLSGWDVEIF